VEILDPEGNKIFREHYNPNEFGIISLNYTLSDQLPLGNYKIMVTTEGAVEEKNILVKDYVLPKFKIEFEDTRSWYTINEFIRGNITANYFFGKQVEGEIEIDIRAYYGVWESIENFKGSLKNGKFQFEIEPTEYAVGIPYNTDNGYLEMNVTVKDTGGHEETKTKMISIARKPILLTLLTDSNVIGTTSNHYLIARYPDGMPVKNAEVEFTYNRYWKDYNSYTGQSTTDSRGIALIKFEYTNQRYLSLKVSDDKTSVQESYYMYGSEGIKVIPDKTYYDVGETAYMDVIYTGDKDATKWAYYDILSRGFVVKTGNIKLDENKKGSFKVQITSDMAPLAEVRVYKTQTNLNVVNDIALFGVGTEYTDINVTIQTDKKLYVPNDDITFKFLVTDDDTPIQAALGLAFVDQSVFEIHERFSGLEEVLHDLEVEFITPQYQICNYVYSPDSPLGSIPTESDSVVSQKELSVSNKASMLSVTGTDHLDYSIQLENYYTTYFWNILIFLGLVGYLALFILALRYKRAAALAIVVLFILPVVTIITAGILYTWTSQFSSGGGGGSLGMDGDDLEQSRWNGDEWDEINRPEEPKSAKDSDDGAFMMGSSSGLGIGPPDVKPPTLDKENGGISENGEDSITGLQKPIQTRQYFPETWYWNPSLITDENGIASLSLKTPDTMTTWNVEAVASTKDMRFGLGTKNVTVFKGFFIEPDIPVSVVRNDEFPLKILIYNYATYDSEVTVTLSKGSWFELLSDSNVASVVVNASSVSSIDFIIQAKEVGKFNITVEGDNGFSIDRIIKEMRIVPDGKPIEELINGALENKQTANATIELLPNRIPNSTDAYVKLQGGMEAITMDGAENYIQFVSGCGEQSTSRLSVDIAAYKNLLKGDLTDEKLFKFENIITQGIQHELMYLIDVASVDGKAIVWHKGESADMWLTAWASFAFQDLEDVGFNFDEDIIPGFQKYLISKQKDDGSYVFPDVGHWSINSKLKNEKLASTAYVTRALLYTNYSLNSLSIRDSINYLEKNVDYNDDSFTLALVLLALDQGKGDNDIRQSLASALIEMKHENAEDKTVWWDWTRSSEGNRFQRYNSKSIETTGYAIMALNKFGGYNSVVNKAIKYLLTERSGGCFGSTHDTAVAFQALNSVGEINIEDLTVKVYVDSMEIKSIRFTEDNKDITYLIDLRPYISLNQNELEITLRSEGEGSIFYQIYNEQYLPWSESELNLPHELELKVTYNTTTIRVNDKITAEVFLRYNGNTSMLKMVLIDLKAPVGFSFIDSEFEELLIDNTINNYEFRDRQALVYIDNVKKDVEIRFYYSLLAIKPIRGTIQGVHAFDMYDPNIDIELGPIEIESYS
jgi:hypothetical protein